MVHFARNISCKSAISLFIYLRNMCASSPQPGFRQRCHHKHLNTRRGNKTPLFVITVQKGTITCNTLSLAQLETELFSCNPKLERDRDKVTLFRQLCIEPQIPREFLLWSVGTRSTVTSNIFSEARTTPANSPGITSVIA